MYHIEIGGLHYMTFNSELEAIEWLQKRGFEEGYGKYALYRPGQATVFATVVRKTPPFSEEELELVLKE
ncbi:MAG TPA: hypothetical protein PLZ99_01715 [Parcubacteria group bacterium]|nr:hypothetical protein [Parcubacteria group bacterium]